jgi:hypothetical protein
VIVPTLALVRLGWLESWRHRLWIVPVLAVAGIAIAAPNLAAVDAGGRSRLLVVIVLMAAGVAGILLGAVVPAQQVRRDLEARSALMLFPKPMSRLGYVLGRWLGGLVVAAAAALAIAAGGGALCGFSPARGTVQPSAWWRITPLGEAIERPANADRLQLSGPGGDGVRWSFAGLTPGQGYELLVRARLSGFDEAGAIEATPLRIVVLDPQGAPQVVELDPASPYGQAPAQAVAPGATAWLRGRERERADLGTDWMRLRLPGAAVGADGRAQVQITRLDPRAGLEVWRDHSCRIAVPQGPLVQHVVRAALAELAGAAVIAAAVVTVAVLANLAVALLAGLTLWVGGSAVATVREVLSWNEVSLPVARMLDLLASCLPDFGAMGQVARVATGEAVPWAAVGSAWIAVLPHLAVLLVLGWWAAARREV